jgi:hypothetical protein
MLPYPSFRGFTYHDLIQHPRFSGSLAGPNERGKHDAVWEEATHAVAVPEEVPAGLREAFARNVVSATMLNRLYAALAEGVERVNGSLDRTTMQWWHAPCGLRTRTGWRSAKPWSAPTTRKSSTTTR